MKRVNPFSVIILMALISGCGGKKQSTDDFITVDVTKSYPKRELILQDFLDVEYILLDDTNDEFVTHGQIMSIGKEYILGRNNIGDGNMFIFDRNGKGLRIINRKGQGAEEYTGFSTNVLDEENNEIFANRTSDRKINVYYLFGNFKRSFPYGEHRFSQICNFDRDHLIYYDNQWDLLELPGSVNWRNSFGIISKRDGSVTHAIQIPYKAKKKGVFFDGSGTVIDFGPSNQRLIPDRNSWILVEISADTIYRLLPDYSLVPFIVRKPSVHSMNPEVFLYPSMFTDRYLFMQTVKLETDLSIREGPMPRRDLMYDKQETALFEYVAYNADFTVKKPVSLAFERFNLPFISNEIAFYERYHSYELVDAFKKGQLRGKLKEIAAELNAESNPVIMVAKHKK